MDQTEYLVVASFTNDSQAEMRLFLEMTCEEVFLSPGQQVDLLAKSIEGLLPITIAYLNDGLQVFPYREFDPDWHIRFNGRVIKPGPSTRLSELP